MFNRKLKNNKDMALNGINIIIERDGSTIAGTRTNEIETGCEVIEVSGAMQGAWREYLAGRKEWKVNVGFLVMDAAKARNYPLQVGNTYLLSMFERSTETVYKLEGYAILKTCRITASIGNLVQGSFVFVGSGELTNAI